MPTPAHPACPKCGYDQSGEIATWQTQCPIEGMCTECAYEFQWENIVDPARVDLLWYVEHANNKRDLISRSLATLIKLLIPNLFWRDVGVSTRIRFPTLLLWLLLIFLVLHTVAIVPVGMGNWSERWGTVRGNGFERFAEYGVIGFICELHNAFFSPFLRIQYGNYGYGYRLGGYMYEQLQMVLMIPGIIVAMSSLWLLVIWAIPVTRGRSSLRFAHLLRAYLVTAVPVILLFEFVRAITGIFFWFPSTVSMAWVPLVFFGFMVLIMIWIQWFWIAAMKIGWGIRPVWHISILGTIASLLAGAIVFVSGAL